MALDTKKNKTIFTKTGDGNNKVEPAKITELENKFTNGEHIQDGGSFAQLGIVYLQLQNVSEELDELRRYLTEDFSGGGGGQGPQGPQGEKGDTGDAGANGSNGVDGVDGTNGTNGATGLRGLTGSRGPTGNTGARGADGSDGSDGANGTNGATGSRGPTGNTGARGANGADGSAGGVYGDTIKILPTDFMGNDDASLERTVIEDDVRGKLGVRVASSSQEVFAAVTIPEGKRVIGYGVYTNSKVTTYLNGVNLITGVMSELASGFSNEIINPRNPYDSTSTNYVAIKVMTTSTSQVIYGAVIIIA